MLGHTVRDLPNVMRDRTHIHGSLRIGSRRL